MKILIKMDSFALQAQNVKTQMSKGVHIVKENFALNDQHSSSAFFSQFKDISILKTQEFREECC